jgi:hypothetical protein
MQFGCTFFACLLVSRAMCKLTVSAAVFHELARCAGFEFCLVRFFLAELAHDMGSLLSFLLSLFDDAADALMLEVAMRSESEN